MAPQSSSADIGAALIAEVQQAGRFLRIPDPGEAARTQYRRAFDAARQCAPAGYHLKYTGRAKGDICFGLLRVSGEDDTEWNRTRLARSRTLTDVDDVIAAVEEDYSAFEVSEEVLPRVLSLLRLFAEGVGVPVVMPKDLTGSGFNMASIRYIAEQQAEGLNRFRLRRGDVVLARRGELGRCAVVREEQQGWICGTGCFVLRPPAELNADYFAAYLPVRRHASGSKPTPRGVWR
ncbi:hypothetical protein ME763_16215 [Streptomyces murinus]|nr:hypothetical protein [Streptomyces murinus]WDO07086.1 hypothetical protein ME763_16215 [Streptomyces murinus]